MNDIDVLGWAELVFLYLIGIPFTYWITLYSGWGKTPEVPYTKWQPLIISLVWPLKALCFMIELLPYD
jgi:hypothetical protein